MNLDSIFRIALVVTAILSYVACVFGYVFGVRNVSRGNGIIALLAIGIFALLVGGTYPLALRFGSAISVRAWLIAFALDGALVFGFVAGVQHRVGYLTMARAALVAAAVIVALMLTMINRANRAVVSVAKQLGLDKNTGRYEPEKNKDCPENLKSLYNAFTMYAQDWDALPPAGNWATNDELTSKVTRDEWMHCPSVSNRKDDKFGYAFNEALSSHKLNGKPLKEMPDAAKTPLLYDSTNLAKGAHDALTSLPKPGRHEGRNNILYCDGHVDAVAP